MEARHVAGWAAGAQEGGGVCSTCRANLNSVHAAQATAAPAAANNSISGLAASATNVLGAAAAPAAAWECRGAGRPEAFLPPRWYVLDRWVALLLLVRTGAVR